MPLVFAGVMSCTTQRVSTDYLRGTNFGQIRDYQFHVDDTTMNPFSLNQVERDIKNELAKRGVLESPEAKVHIRISPKEFISKQQSSSVGIGMGGGSYGFGSSVGVAVPVYSQYLNQQYVIGIYDDTNRLIWQGKLDLKMPARVEGPEVATQIQKGVQKLFRNYPPRN